jgi:2-methylisocitrate lyase-like PEP mutase family enzyme
MTVYVLMVGENHEGGDVINVFASLDDAVEAAQAVATGGADIVWIRQLADEDEDEPAVWSAGCKWMVVKAFAVLTG